MTHRTFCHRIFVLVVLSLTMAALHQTSAQYGTITVIRGRVQSANAFGLYPVAGITVTLMTGTPSGIQPVSQTITGYDGMYYFQGIPPGSYRVLATHPTGASVVQDFQFIGPRYDVAPLQF